MQYTVTSNPIIVLSIGKKVQHWSVNILRRSTQHGSVQGTLTADIMLTHSIHTWAGGYQGLHGTN